MSQKPVHEMTDEEIDALTQDQLEALSAGEGVVDRPDANREGDAPADDAGAEGGEGEGAGEGAEGGAAAGGESLSAEELEAVANEDRGMIPLARFNEVIETARQQQELISQLLQNRQAPAATQAEPEPAAEVFDFKAKGRELIKLISEGDEDGAAALQEEIEAKREEQRALDMQAAEERATQRFAAQQAQNEITSATRSIYERMPFLNSENKAADAAAIAAVNARAKQLIAGGTAPAAALKQASDALGPVFAQILGVKLDEASAGAVNNAAAGTGAKKPGADTRTAAAIQRNLNIRQPDTLKTGVGNREAGATISVKDLSDEQLEKALADGTLDDLLSGAPKG